MPATTTPVLQMSIPGTGDQNWDVPADSAFNTLDSAAGGVATVTASGGNQTINLTQAQAACPFLNVNGTLNGGWTLINYPANSGGRKFVIPGCTMNGNLLYVRNLGSYNGQVGRYGVYFAQNFGIPHPIILWPGVRVFWDYGGGYPGQVINFPVNYTPNGFLPCDGSVHNNIDHDILFDIVNYSYGGSNPNFATPDYRGYATAGADDMGTGNANRFAGSPLAGLGPGNYFGEVNHAMPISEMPSHYHFIDHGHTAFQGAHSHYLTQTVAVLGGAGAPGGGYGWQEAPPGSLGTDVQQPSVTVNPISGAASSWTGGAGNPAHNNLQPTKVVAKWIRW